jgi:hypothetical protein
VLDWGRAMIGVTGVMWVLNGTTSVRETGGETTFSSSMVVASPIVV